MTKNKNSYIFTTIFQSNMYEQDNDFYLDAIEEKEKCDYTKARKLFEDGYDKFTEEELDKINEEKANYYFGDFWNNPSYIKDNKHGIIWTIYVDEENNEIIVNYGTNIEDNELLDGEELEQLGYDEIYKELFLMRANNIRENEKYEEVDYLDFNGDGSPAEGSDSNKADYILKILGKNGNYYGFWEYDEKK